VPDGGGLVFQSGKEVLDVVGEGQIDFPVGELGVEGFDLLAEAGCAVAEFGHPGSKFIQANQLFVRASVEGSILAGAAATPTGR
jgi:hypothetical protein